MSVQGNEVRNGGVNPWMIATIVVIIISAAIVIVTLSTAGKSDGAKSKDSRVVATVNDEEILRDDLYDQMYTQMGDKMLEQMINDKLIDQAAAKANVSISNEEIDKMVEEELENIKKEVGSQDQFEMLLAQSGMTLDDLKGEMKKSLPMQTKIERLLEPQITVTDEDISNYFEENKDTFVEPEQVKASHILVETKDEADALLKQINEGADFAELATANSKDTRSALEGGDLGFFPRGRMVEPFEKAAFALAVGETSEVVESVHGFHIIHVTDKKDEKVFTLEEKKEDIKDQLTNKQMSELYPTWLQTLKTEATINKM